MSRAQDRSARQPVTDAATIAWIFYSLRLASDTAPAKFDAISQVADGLCHAVPTHRELQSSLSWLSSAGLVAKQSGGYSVSASGLEVFCEVVATSASQVLHQLTGKIRSRVELSPNTSLEQPSEK